MTERLRQFNEGHSLNPSPNLSLTSSYSPNGTTFGDPLRFMGSQDFHGIFTRKTIDIYCFPVIFLWTNKTFWTPKRCNFGLVELVRKRSENSRLKLIPGNPKLYNDSSTHSFTFPQLTPNKSPQQTLRVLAWTLLNSWSLVESRVFW
jgi:hypothetical protein